jgi:hypothetical protein
MGYFNGADSSSFIVIPEFINGFVKSKLIPILFNNCRLPEPVIPAKAGIQTLPVGTTSDSIGNL